jgi:hypothetical protein
MDAKEREFQSPRSGRHNKFSSVAGGASIQILAILAIPAILAMPYIGLHVWHSAALMGSAGAAPDLERTTPSDVEQKLLLPAFELTGVATAT